MYEKGNEVRKLVVREHELCVLGGYRDGVRLLSDANRRGDPQILRPSG